MLDEVTLPPDIGWAIADAHMSNGYAPEAAREVLRWAREDFGFKTVVVLLGGTNSRSNRVAEKLGFVDGYQIPDSEGKDQLYNVLILPSMERSIVKEDLSMKES